MGDSFIRRKISFQQDKLGVHDTARRIRIKIEQVAQFFRIFAVELFQQGVAVILVQFVQHVGGVVGRHLGDNLGGYVIVQIFQHVHGHVLVQFGQRLGGVFLGHAAQGADLLFETQILKMIGHVSRMHELGIGVFCGKIFIMDVWPLRSQQRGRVRAQGVLFRRRVGRYYSGLRAAGLFRRIGTEFVVVLICHGAPLIQSVAKVEWSRPRRNPATRSGKAPPRPTASGSPKTRTQWRHGNPGQIFAIPGSQPQNTADC